MTILKRLSAELTLLLLLAGCHSSRPVDANLVGMTASSRADDNNFIAAEDRRENAPLVPSAGMRWRWDAARATASFGASPTGTTFSIECNADRKQIVFHRFLGARGSNTGTMSFTGNGHVASLPAATRGDVISQSDGWQAGAPTSDLAAAVAKVFTGPGNVEIAVSGSTELVTAASPMTQLPFERCQVSRN